MKHRNPSTRAILLVGAFATGMTGSSLAVTPNPGPFTGCLASKTSAGSATTKGQVYNVSASASPTAPCLSGDSQVKFSNAAGPAGTNGTNGTNGTDGTNGTNGKDGVGTTDAYYAQGDKAELPGVKLSLPPGNYAITLTLRVPNAGTALLTSACDVATTAVPSPSREILVFVPPAPPPASVAAYATTAFTQAIGASDGLTIICESPSTEYEMLALKVGLITPVSPVPLP